MNFKLTKEQTEEVLYLYKNKTSIKELANKFNCCNTTMSKFLVENGVTPSKKGYSNAKRFSKEKEEEIIRLYKAGKNQKELAAKYHTFNTSIRRVLIRNGIIPRPGSKVTRYCKHNPFKSYKRHDEYTEYFLGLLLTDGCITMKHKSSKNYSINLSLTSSDGYIVEKFRDWASPNQKVSYLYQKLNKSYMTSVSISNREAVDWLMKKGNFKNKSFECKIYCPITWHILRGIFDGDGGWRAANKDGLGFFICGLSKVFMKQIQRFLLKHSIKARLHFTEPDKYHKNGLYYVTVTNYADVIKIGYNMYLNASIFLNRKYDKWLTFYENKRDKYALNSGEETAIQP